ncbi:OmpA family protein [Photobacterium leiognathi]|uniref:OmpA family protein n=1 Tax=Photobacterium leiognathi TaxID=553611 RepID=UPI0034E50227
MSPDIHFAGLGLAYHWGAPAPIVELPVYVDQVTVTTLEELKLTVPFAFDSSTITAGDAAKLAPFEQRLKDQDAAQIYVIGHTDSRGSEAYNQKLSEKRAQAVADALGQHLNVGETRIIAQGRGESDPIASNQTEEGRAQNRRVDIISPSIDVETVTQVIAE